MNAIIRRSSNYAIRYNVHKKLHRNCNYTFRSLLMPFRSCTCQCIQKSFRCSDNQSTIKLLFSVFTLLGLQTDDEESPEQKLITIIKRSILCIQREDYDKAEKMLHVALKMAQDIQSKDGITYIYDVMANLAMEREDFKKAEKLFVEVMRRLLQEGYSENHIKMLSVSSKLAHMAELQGEIEKANLGFTWSLQKIEAHLKNCPNDKDARELWSLTRNWFGQLLMKQEQFEKAIQCFKDALSCLSDISDVKNEDVVTILNNISVAYVNLENYAEAKKFLLRAMELLQTVKDTSQEAIVLANLGLIYLQEGVLDKAKQHCSQAWRKAKETKSDYASEQAEYCIAQIELLNK